MLSKAQTDTTMAVQEFVSIDMWKYTRCDDTVKNFHTGLTSVINIVKHAYCNKLEFSRMTMFAWTNNSAICIDRCVIDNNKCVVWNHNTTDHPSMANTLSQIFIWNSCLPLACKRHIDRFWLANSDLKFSVAWRWLLV